MSDVLKKDMAVRLARLSSAMGLDDEDENLLWRYLGELKAGQKLEPEILHVLVNLAETQPVVVTSYKWEARMPMRFYNDKQRKLAKFGFHLRSKEEKKMATPVFVSDMANFRTNLEAFYRHQCFVEWFERITSCLRDDGVNWEPPTDNDVELELTIESVSLHDVLRQFM